MTKFIISDGRELKCVNGLTIKEYISLKYGHIKLIDIYKNTDIDSYKIERVLILWSIKQLSQIIYNIDDNSVIDDYLKHINKTETMNAIISCMSSYMNDPILKELLNTEVMTDHK